MKKFFIYLSLFFTVLSIASCSNIKSINITSNFKKKYPEDSFYFIDFKYFFRMDTTLRYYGLLYSKNLKKLRYPDGINIFLKSDENDLEFIEDYEGLILKIKLEKILKEKIKELSIEKFYVDSLVGVRPSPELFKNILLEKKRTSLYTTNVYIFVDNLDEIDIEEYKEKVYELARIIDKDLNIFTSLNVYIKDNKFFENYESVKYQIFSPFRDEKNIKKILNKIKTEEKLSNNEKLSLIEILSLDYYYNPDVIVDVPTLKFNINILDYKMHVEKYYMEN